MAIPFLRSFRLIHFHGSPLSAISLACDSTTERLEHILNSDDTIIPTSQYKGEMQDTLQDMKIISHCCVHMTRLIDDVLTLSKIGE